MNSFQRELSDCAAKDSAANIINGFLNRFEAPTCVEQALIVSAANAWLEAYEADDFRSFAAVDDDSIPFGVKPLSQQNQNDTQNHTD
jgi:hypothetical protein